MYNNTCELLYIEAGIQLRAVFCIDLMCYAITKIMRLVGVLITIFL